jgi:hypothetical protein
MPIVPLLATARAGSAASLSDLPIYVAGPTVAKPVVEKLARRIAMVLIRVVGSGCRRRNRHRR